MPLNHLETKKSPLLKERFFRCILIRVTTLLIGSLLKYYISCSELIPIKKKQLLNVVSEGNQVLLNLPQVCKYKASGILFPGRFAQPYYCNEAE